MQFRVIVVTDQPKNRQDRLQYTAPQLARSVITEFSPIPTIFTISTAIPQHYYCYHVNKFPNTVSLSIPDQYITMPILQQPPQTLVTTQSRH